MAIFVVIVGSLLPDSSAPMRWLDRLQISDKLEHFLAYEVLSLLPTIHERRAFILMSVAGAVALGIGLEYAQLYSGWREFETGDMLADAIGVLSGAAAAIPIRSTQSVRPLLASGRR